MKYLTALHTDVGIKKNANQDSLLRMQAATDAGNVLLASVCDGMGGLARGEVASAVMVRAAAAWFREKLPGLLAAGFSAEALHASWMDLIAEGNRRIAGYGARVNVDLGTTAVLLLLVGSSYYVMNVGDSRVYLLSDNIYQITKDQTYVQREIDAGRMTYAQASVDPQRSVLLQCIGASAGIEPDFYTGTFAPNQMFLLCSDGFRHVITPQELYGALNPRTLRAAAPMEKALYSLIECNKARREEDNISALLVRT